MSSRKVAASLLSLVLLPFCLVGHAQFNASSSGDPRNSRPGSVSDGFGDPFGGSFGTGSRISGTVLGSTGHGVGDANIELRDLQHGGRIYNTQANAAGSYELRNISPGSYELTATSGSSTSSERVQIYNPSDDITVDLRMSNAGSHAPGGSNSPTVSLSQYAVPSKAREALEKASQLLGRKKYIEARQKVEQALTIYPHFAEALTLRGILEENEGRRDQAIADYRKAIESDARYPLGYLALASVYNSAGHFQEAAPVIEQAERLAPNFWQTYFEKARCQIGRGDFQAAIRSINRAAELHPTDTPPPPEFHLVRGYALVGLIEFPSAAQEIETFLSKAEPGRVADDARRVLNQLRTQTITATK